MWHKLFYYYESLTYEQTVTFTLIDRLIDLRLQDLNPTETRSNNNNVGIPYLCPIYTLELLAYVVAGQFTEKKVSHPTTLNKYQINTGFAYFYEIRILCGINI